MTYRIEYENGQHCNYAHSRKDLLELLKILKNKQISDIRKIWKNGTSQTVMDIYKEYISH